jgi:hydrocephalus-inducing protein
LINLKYRCKLVDGETGIPDTGYYSVNPKEGVISPSCDEWLTVKFQPTECDENNIRLLMLQIENLNPEQEKLIIELDAESDRPICHFELQNNSQMKEKKPELDHKYKFLEFESIGTKILNTKRFYVANPTS